MRLTKIAAIGAALAAAIAVAPPAQAANFVVLQNFGSGKCLQPDPGNPLAEGVAVVQMPCSNNAVQRWSPVAFGSGTVKLVNQASGFCMRARRNVDRQAVTTHGCTDISDNRWQLPSNVPNAVPERITSKVSGGNRVLDVAGLTGNGAPAQIITFASNDPFRLWFVRLG